MPFYYTDNLTCYIFTAITEHNEGLGDERRDNKKRIEDIVYYHNRAQLKELCQEFLALSSEMDTSLPIFAAMINSIDFDILNGYLRDWLADCDVDEAEEPCSDNNPCKECTHCQRSMPLCLDEELVLD